MRGGDREENRGAINGCEQIISRPLQRWDGREEINGLLCVDLEPLTIYK